MMKGKRERILQAALELVSEKGISMTTISEIAEKSDVGKGTVYEYFASKEQIITESMRYGSDICIGMIKSTSMVEGQGFRECLALFVNAIHEVIDTRYFTAFSMEISRLFESEAVKASVEKHMLSSFRELLDIEASILQKGMEEGLVKAPDSTLSYVALLDAIILMCMQQAGKALKADEPLDQFIYEMALKLFN
ncbi:MAG: TetR/AcrR family transcriptional regulator [Clostridia bacterium]